MKKTTTRYTAPPPMSARQALALAGLVVEWELEQAHQAGARTWANELRAARLELSRLKEIFIQRHDVHRD